MDNLNRPGSTLFSILVSLVEVGPTRWGQGQTDTAAPKLEEEPKFTCLYQERQFSFKIFPDDISNK